MAKSKGMVASIHDVEIYDECFFFCFVFFPLYILNIYIPPFYILNSLYHLSFITPFSLPLLSLILYLYFLSPFLTYSLPPSFPVSLFALSIPTSIPSTLSLSSSTLSLASDVNTDVARLFTAHLR